MLKKLASYEIYLSVIWLLCILLVNPMGDFPLNDDWSYAHNTRALVLENKIEFHDWGAMTLIAHTIWGAMFCKIFGFSFTVLRVSTLVLGWGAIMGCFHFFKEGGMHEKHAFGGTLLLLFNTFFFVNAFTYMTEVPFLCFFLWAAYFSLKSINGKGSNNIIFATLFSIIAILIRQHGILVPLAFFFTYIIKNKLSLKTVIQSVTPLVLTYASMQIFVNWRKANYGLSKNFGQTKQLIDNITNGELKQTIETEIHIFFEFWGLFLFPLLLIILIYFWKKTPHIVKLIATVSTLTLSYPYSKIYHQKLLGNTFENLHIGPVSLSSYDKLVPTRISQMDWENFLLFLFITAIFLLILIFIQSYNLLVFLKNKKSEFVSWSSIFAFIAAFGYFLFLTLNKHQIDRYVLINIPFLILFIFPKKMDLKIPKIIRIISISSFGIIAIYSIIATHDYLAWNRAEWKAIDYALEEIKIDPTELNASFEYRGLYNIKNNWASFGWEDLEKWNDAPQKHSIAFSPICKYNTLKKVPYQRFMPPRTDTMYLLKKASLLPYDTLTCNMDSVTLDGKHFYTNQKDYLLETNNAIAIDKSHSGKKSVMVKKNNEYSCTFKLKNVFPCEKILLSSWRFPANEPAQATIATDRGWLFCNGRIEERNNKGWVKFVQEFSIPSDYQGDEVSIYFYNPSQNKVWFDDLSIVRMK